MVSHSLAMDNKVLQIAAVMLTGCDCGCSVVVVVVANITSNRKCELIAIPLM